MPSQWVKSTAVLGATVVALGGFTIPAALPAMGQSVKTGNGHGTTSDALKEFERLKRRQADAWARHDGAAFAATFTPNADVVTFNGDHLRTRQGIAVGMQRYFDEFISDNTIRYLGEHVRFAGPGLAIIVRTTCLVESGEKDCRDDSLSTNTNVMTRHQGRWLQESFQNTRAFSLP
ncbi:SgcJ/EcaC family oxidoreductase [Actinomadura viridis]|uniref:SgcJ/EcaC family oxidoreductase n=1 Tax=Actinomadura viridis TaxID=58110 RepID=UPI0036C0DA97